ncbi:ribbon-helix-helix domain-containing protein [Magnetovibrio blakemorei]|uniref:Addiction module antitoxin n=1 Tax=Magnetovibrio blakemorei TaxID=28181 RepID=A0A1E5Q9P8_9PROT|nr:type II toxin-antitoxin system ParD family antitoxin [Magnetovibrio blakemorei]OEJ68414.1 addiction module antitoxin [Magnetovibrio blakemorei]
MTRQSISFTDPNSEWLRLKVDVEGEYKSNSEVVNELIRKERAKEKAEIAAVRAALIEGEQSGMSDKTPDQIIKAVLERKHGNGDL